MAFSKPPAWICNPAGLNNSLQHNIYLPQDLHQHLTLQDNTLFLQGARQFFFWKGDLAPTLPKNTIMIAFLGPQGLQRINVLNVMKALSSIIDISSLIEVYQGANSSFLGLSFSDPQVVSAISTYFLYFEDSIVTHIIHSASNIHPFRLLWLPPLFHQDRVHHLLSSLTSFYNLRKESIQTSDFGYTPTNTIRGSLSPKPGQSIADLPHLLSLPAPHKGSALLLITGRPPLCLKCREIGHLRKDCSMKKCSSCLKVHFLSSPCGTSSYSSVASRNITHYQDSDWLSHLADEDTTPAALSSHDHLSDISSPTNDKNLPQTTSSQIIIASPASDSPMDFASETPFILPTLLDQSISSSECDRTFTSLLDVAISSILPDKPLPSHLQNTSSSSLTCQSQEIISPTSTSRIPVSKQTATKTTLPGASLSKDHTSSPPTTRSRSSHKKRIVSLPTPSLSGLRSECISYTHHSSTLKDPHSSFITTHYAPMDSPHPPLDNSNDSDSSHSHEAFSDVSVDLASHQEAMDQTSSRKRKNLPSPTNQETSSTFTNKAESTMEVTLPPGSSPPLQHVHQDSSCSLTSDASSTVTPPLLSEPDSVIARQLHLDPLNFNRLKLSCPGKVISSTSLKKLKLLIAYSIPVLQAADHPQFFNLSPTSISNRLKALSSHHPASLNITDLFASNSRFELLTGSYMPQYTLPSISADPFSLTDT